MNEGKAVEREWFPVFSGTELYAVKWRNWKVHFFWQERMDDTPQERADGSLNMAFRHAWVLHAITKALAPFQESLKKYPPIPMGTSDPYTPPTGK